MKKQPEITDKTRQAFVDIFCELYRLKPIEKISVQEIANKSGYNRSTFYQYFADLYELLEYVENDLLTYIKRVKKHSTKDSIPQDITNLFSEKGMYLNALLGDYGNIRFLERLKKEIPLNERDLNIPDNTPITPYLVEFHISTSFSLFRLWQRRQDDLSPEELFDLINRLYTSGISTVT